MLRNYSTVVLLHALLASMSEAARLLAVGSHSSADAYWPLAPVTPVDVPVGNGKNLSVIAFYAPGVGLTEWDRRTGGAPFANFYPLGPHTINVTLHGASGVFTNSEAAYQSMKWWQDEPTRHLFEQCAEGGLRGGQESYVLKRQLEKSNDEHLKKLLADDYDGLGKYEAMLVVLRQKWRLPGFKELLLSTAGMLLVEHCEVKGRDPYWTDDFNGGGQNRLGGALMTVRSELLQEQGEENGGWPEGVDLPAYHPDGTDESSWQQTVNGVAAYLAENTVEEPLTR